MLLFLFPNYLFVIFNPGVIVEFFNYIGELVIPIVITIKEAKAKNGIHSATVKANIRNYSI